MTEPNLQSLPEIYRSVQVPTTGSWIKKFLAFAGPAFLVSVGYMDPGNWGTDLAGGSKFGYQLLWVILLSNLIAQLLQVLCVRLGLVTGKDLAMACRDYYSRPVAILLWLLCELAIIACDLAEVIGSAVALKLLFGIPETVGVLLTGFDVILLLSFLHFGFRKIEAIILTLVATIFGCFCYEITIAGPNWAQAIHGSFVPTLPNQEAFLISLGILGATVMPHNLYLHSSIVQSRRTGEGPQALKEAIRYNTWDTILALTFAFFVNAAILILAAAVFWKSGHVVEALEDGKQLLGATLGATAGVAFALALLASGQSSTITGTLAGQIVMEGFLNLRIKPWVRRLITRLLAIIPAVIVFQTYGDNATVELLVISQVVLSMQLPFAIFPLVMITSDRAKMGEFANSKLIKILAYSCAVVISGLNVYLLYQNSPLWLMITLATFGIGFSIWVRYIYGPRQNREVPEAA